MAEYALEQLREAIILGELPAGTPLRLDELARSLGMSISPIREAVRQLEALGLAKHVPHQGARVLDFDIDELRDLFQVRLALESLAVRRAAERFTDADAAAALAQLERFDAAAAVEDVRETMRAHTEFHFTLYEASQSQWLVALIRPAWDRSERFRPALLTSRDGPQERHRAFDQALYEACAGHDPDAAATALHGHLELASIIFERELDGRGIFDPR
ncbi:MAG: GntR family transcriptional regulator [Gaiellaceae bacterium]